jgi:hypothetical protein
MIKKLCFINFVFLKTKTINIFLNIIQNKTQFPICKKLATATRASSVQVTNLTLCVSEIHFNYKPPLKLTSPKWSFPFEYTYQNCVRIFVCLGNATFASQLILLGLISLTLHTHKTPHYSIFLGPNSVPSALIVLLTSEFCVIICIFTNI